MAEDTDSQLRGLQTKLRKWFLFLTHSTHTPEQREAHWLNPLEHFCGNHANCPVDHPNSKLRVSLAGNPTGREQLQAFLRRTAKLVRQTRKDLNTQLCESFNAVKAHFANNTYSWKFSWPVRAMCAVMQLNTPESWKFEPFRASRLPRLHESTIRLLAGRAAEQAEQNSSRRALEFEDREKTRGTSNRGTAGKETSACRDYHIGAPSGRMFQESGEEATVDPRASNHRPRKWVLEGSLSQILTTSLSQLVI
jgi:hypothetical protein